MAEDGCSPVHLTNSTEQGPVLPHTLYIEYHAPLSDKLQLLFASRFSMFQLVTSSNQPPGHLCNKRVLGGLVCWLPGKPIHIANALLARGIEAQSYTLSQSGNPSHASAHLNHLREPVYANLYYSYQCLFLPVSHIVVISVPLSAVSWVPCTLW